MKDIQSTVQERKVKHIKKRLMRQKNPVSGGEAREQMCKSLSERRHRSARTEDHIMLFVSKSSLVIP
eukprot:1141429-Pelagomonas_calceolata.AAC.2